MKQIMFAILGVSFILMLAFSPPAHASGMSMLYLMKGRIGDGVAAYCSMPLAERQGYWDMLNRDTGPHLIQIHCDADPKRPRETLESEDRPSRIGPR